MSAIESKYHAAFAYHKPFSHAARQLLPDGITSDSRYVDPFPLYIVSAKGSRKWDIEGKEFIDLWGGHGSLLWGHAPAEVVEAASEQLARGTHYGACHPSTVTWARLVNQLVPSAERVRFTGSGTEAVLLALHLARAFTGRSKILRFEGHYHGWSAHVGTASSQRDSGPSDPVVRRAEEVIVTCPNQIDAAAAALQANPDVGAVILEPTGPCSGVVPLQATFAQSLRALTHEHGALLIFDEVVTGFRLAAGGAQSLFDVTPDLTTFAKVLCGGLPGGAVVGRADVLDLLSKHDNDGADRAMTLPHLGTFSGNPVSAAAGIATLRRIASSPPYSMLDEVGRTLRAALNQLFQQHGLDWLAYGQGSCVKFLIGHSVPGVAADEATVQLLNEGTLLQRGRARTARLLRLALLLHGVDMSLSSFVSAAHNNRDIDQIVAAFAAAIHELKRDGELS